MNQKMAAYNYNVKPISLLQVRKEEAEKEAAKEAAKAPEKDVGEMQRVMAA